MVIRAKTAGFCMGVILALRNLDDIVEKGTVNGPIFTLGPIIHNPQVLEEYAIKGIVTADSPEEIPRGATVVIRAHGVPKNVLEILKERGAHIVDATCPKVKKAQLLIATEARQGRTLLLYGEDSHPEVKGLLSYAAAGAHVFDSQEKLDAIPLEEGRRYCLASQTTQDRRKFDAIATKLKSRQDRDVTVLHTVCDATRERQEETVCIAEEADIMVVVGGFDSGNTRRLVQVVTAQRKPCLHVETARDLPLEDLKRFPKIGLTAGASTPKHLIDEIHYLLEAAAEEPGRSRTSPDSAWREGGKRT
ncbi:4-hydroxy-3-methylbut-2-enyl diphosphate reductase [Candidatus Deferrimicrobium sp.]|uniref:4-hydroxy-3-methylbut-2-enyl diphosphate reductase n=1 Tax=Candidatus Deferrimicrobium sp. TaxID=3060586 RepID=UPI0039C88B90